MQVLNALQLKNKKGVKKPSFNAFTQPIQFLPKAEKDEDWCMHNMDWLEWQGIKQIRLNARRMMKNYKLAKGTIDKSDYIPEEADDMQEMLQILTTPDDSAMELKFYPIVPNVINILTAEFAKRNTKIDYRAVDEYSYNEVLDAKYNELSNVLIQDAQSKLLSKMIEMGMDPNSPEAQQQLSTDAISQLPYIEDFYSKKYQTLAEQWAVKQHEIDSNRFHLDELEEIAFRDMLIVDREFWHFKMLDDDYDVELWNPVLTFYHKSPSARYISQGNWVGKIDMCTISDVIDMYGQFMDNDQLEILERLYPTRGGMYMLNGLQNDGSYYNPELDHSVNLHDSLAMKQHLSYREDQYDSNDIISWIVGESEHTGTILTTQMLRVTTAYWKTQRKVGYLTSVGEDGQVHNQIVDEDYKITNNPIYNTKIKEQFSAETLVFGDHIEWIWINQTWGGIKIGPNRMMINDTRDSDFSPIYIGIGQNKIGALKFQFKGESTLYGCKLPVEGKVFTERNTKSTSLVDLMKPAQIGFNLVNNQISDILIDEIGTVIALDQNGLPKQSLGEDWGKGNYAKAYVAMKDFQILPMDTTLSNTENGLAMPHLQQLDLSQTNRLMSRIQIANYFKNLAMEVVGITPQRLGEQLGQIDSAKGVEMAITGSHAQTEQYFIQHSDYLMPRVHQMRTDLAQFYHSNKSSIQLQNMISPDERTFFEINGTDLMLRDLHVYQRTNANARAALEQIKQTLMSNNTTGATIFDLPQIMQTDSIGSLNNVLRNLEKKQEIKSKQEAEQAQQAQQAELAAREKEKQMLIDADLRKEEMRNRTAILAAEIKSAGYGAMQDLNANNQSDYLDVLDRVQKDEAYQDTMNFNREKEGNKRNIEQQKVDLEKERLNLERTKATIPLQVARENKNKYDKPSNKK